MTKYWRPPGTIPPWKLQARSLAVRTFLVSPGMPPEARLFSARVSARPTLQMSLRQYLSKTPRASRLFGGLSSPAMADRPQKRRCAGRPHGLHEISLTHAGQPNCFPRMDVFLSTRHYGQVEIHEAFVSDIDDEIFLNGKRYEAGAVRVVRGYLCSAPTYPRLRSGIRRWATGSGCPGTRQRSTSRFSCDGEKRSARAPQAWDEPATPRAAIRRCAPKKSFTP